MEKSILLILILCSCRSQQPSQHIQPNRHSTLDTISASELLLYPSYNVTFRRLPDLRGLYIVETRDLVNTVAPNVIINAKKASGVIDVNLQTGTGNVVHEATRKGKDKSVTKTDNSTNIEQPNSGISFSWQTIMFVVAALLAMWLARRYLPSVWRKK